MHHARSAVIVATLLLVVMRAALACHAPPSLAVPMAHGQLHRLEEAVDEAVFDNCFLAGTLVVAGQDSGSGRVERFTKPVQEVRAGDQVLAQNPVTGEVGYRRVVRTFENVTTSVVSVTVGAPECLPLRQAGRTERHAVGQAGSGEEGGEDAEPPTVSQTIRCTPGHPWRVRGGDGALRWVFARDLRVGDRLVPEAGPEQVVLALDVRAEVARTFNFEVEGWHTYYVAGDQGQPGVLVHNRSAAWLAKRAAWARYQARAGTQGWGYRRWSRSYRALAENRRVGQLQESATGEFAKRFGGQWEHVGSQVHVAQRGGTRIIDHLLRSKADPSMLVGLEVKSGGAIRNMFQVAKDARLEAGLGRFFGSRAGALRGQSVYGATGGRGIPTFVWNVARLD